MGCQTDTSKSSGRTRTPRKGKANAGYWHKDLEGRHRIPSARIRKVYDGGKI
jgi:hypothetical protein